MTATPTEKDRDEAQQCVTGWLRGGIKSPELTERLSRAIARARQEGRQEMREAAAKAAYDYDGPGHIGGWDRELGDSRLTQSDIAAAIRALPLTEVRP